LRSVLYGIPVVLHERFDAAAVNRDIDEKRITIISVVSTMLLRMLEDRGEHHPYPSSLRCVLVGGGPVPEPLLKECVRRGVPVVQTYGLTEAASQVTTLSPTDALRRLGSAGKPLFPTEVRIAGDDDETLPQGACGEILVCGPTVTPGYLDRLGDTKAALRGGWLHTGDVGYLDEEGFLYVRDRRDGVIISGGENVYATEVETVLCSHPAVREAGVTGVPDTRWGECVVATVVLRERNHASESDLLTFCTSRLASYKVPKRIQFSEGLPRNAVGKLLRRILREEHLSS
jgi:O-succinylbenzoic acid--CoA ligase